MQRIFQKRLSPFKYILLITLAFLACEQEEQDLDQITTLKKELRKVKELNNRNQEFAENLNTQLQTIQESLQSVYDSKDNLLGISVVDSSLSPLDQIKVLDSILNNSQFQLDSLSTVLDEQKGNPMANTSSLLIQQFQDQINSYRADLEEAEEKNKEMEIKLALVMDSLNDISEDFTNKINLLETQNLEYQDTISKTKDENKTLKDSIEIAKLQIEQAEIIRVFAEANVYFNSLNTLINRNGKIKRSDWDEARQLALLALERFREASRRGISEADKFINELNTKEVYRKPMNRRRPVTSNNAN